MADQEQFLATLQSSPLQEDIVDVRSYAGELTIELAPEKVHGFLRMLRDDYGFTYFGDLSTVDHYTDEGRFELCYNLVNMAAKQRLRISTRLEEDQPEIATVTDLYPGANWLEREAFDMMGIRFTGHPDLRRMFLPEDFEWYPMRKEFPLLGIPGSIPLPEKDPPKPYN